MPNNRTRTTPSSVLSNPPSTPESLYRLRINTKIEVNIKVSRRSRANICGISFGTRYGSTRFLLPPIVTLSFSALAYSTFSHPSCPPSLTTDRHHRNPNPKYVQNFVPSWPDKLSITRKSKRRYRAPREDRGPYKLLL